MKTIAKTVLIDGSSRVLLLKRSLTDGARPGEWDFPGGGVDEGEDVMQAATREIFEEAGINIELKQLSLIYTGTIFVDQYNETHHRLLFVARVQSPKIALSAEHTSYRWFPVEDAIAQWPHPFWSVGLRYAVDHDLLH